MLLPSLYTYYTSGGIFTGLQVDWEQFTLNYRDITIISGTMNYFRVPREYWSDRLRKMKAAGLNTVETSVPWNLHEPEIAKYDFGHGETEFQNLLDIEAFLNATKQEDLFTILKIGPVIDPDLDLGGVPSWLLRNTMYEVKAEQSVLAHVRRFLTILFFILNPLQFTNGGPIIGFYVGNEFLDYSFHRKDAIFTDDQMLYIRNYARKNGLREFVFTKDDPIIHAKAFVPGIINVHKFHTVIRDMPKTSNKDDWMKWQNYWNRYNTQLNNTVIADIAVVLNYKLGYVNLYRFVGGTTFGLITGAFRTSQDYLPITNSYDFGNIITETGQFSPQYHVIKNTILLMGTNEHLQKVMLKPNPPVIFRKSSIIVSNQLSLKDALANNTKFIENKFLVPMEALHVHSFSGQSSGYIVYKKKMLRYGPDSELRISGHVPDNIMVLINGELKAHTSELLPEDKDIIIPLKGNKNDQSVTLHLVVENCGRSINYDDYKGLSTDNNVTLNSRPIKNWDIYPLDFKNNWTANLTGWYYPVLPTPSFYKATWRVEEPTDIFIDMQDWQKGIIILNGFILGRYLSWGPQQLVFAPAAFQRKGGNEIIIFEHFKSAKEIRFTTRKHFHKQHKILNSIKYNSVAVKLEKLPFWIFFVFVFNAILNI